MKTQTGMNDSQIEEVIRTLRTTLRRHRKEFVPMAVQQALTAREFRRELLAPLLRYCGASNTIVRRVDMNRFRSQQEAFAAAADGRVQIVDCGIVAQIPKHKSGECEVIFFTGVPDGAYYTDEYARRGLKPANPWAVLAINADDKAFADSHPNMVEWETRTGRKGCVAFCLSLSYGRFMYVGNSSTCIKNDYWYAGVPKTAPD